MISHIFDNNVLFWGSMKIMFPVLLVYGLRFSASNPVVLSPDLAESYHLYRSVVTGDWYVVQSATNQVAEITLSSLLQHRDKWLGSVHEDRRIHVWLQTSVQLTNKPLLDVFLLDPSFLRM